MRDTTLADLRAVAFRRHEGGGMLTVYPGADPDGVPFPIARVFTISRVPANGVRGRHAHRACSQLFACLGGSVELRVDDGRDARTLTLADPASGLLVPPGLWVEISFPVPGSILAVFCDRPYEEADYLRNRDAFLAAKGLGPGGRGGAR